MESDDGSLTLIDIDNDGDLDIFVCRGAVSGANQLWQNDGVGNFTDVAATAGVDTDVMAYDVVKGDFNNDGLMDLYLSCSGAANVLYLNQGERRHRFDVALGSACPAAPIPDRV